MLVSKEVKINVNGKNIKWYGDKGYDFPKVEKEDGRRQVPLNTFIMVKVEDLPPNSTYKVDVECDYCHNVKTMMYDTYLHGVREDGKYYCSKCYNIFHFGKFEEWCVNNNKQIYLEHWDYDLNEKLPSEMPCSNKQKIYLKCPRGIHESKCFTFQQLKKNEYKDGWCDKCNSLGQWLVDSFGEDAVKTYWSDKNNCSPFKIGRHTDTKLWLKCPNCKTEKFMNTSHFATTKIFPCNACSDGISYPNKFMYNLLKQLEVNFKAEYNKSDAVWCENYKYDFYLYDYDVIIEMDGEFHYKITTLSDRSIEEIQLIDAYKNKIALDNGVYVIRINCNYDLAQERHDYIKNNILNSPLNLLFDLSIINWNEIEKRSLSSRVIRCCELWNNGMKDTRLIANELGILQESIPHYLTQGTNLGLCDYNAKENMKTSRDYAKQRSKEVCNKKIEVFKDGESQGVFESLTILCNKSLELFGVEFKPPKVSLVANGKRNHHRGYTFKYIKD